MSSKCLLCTLATLLPCMLSSCDNASASLRRNYLSDDQVVSFFQVRCTASLSERCNASGASHRRKAYTSHDHACAQIMASKGIDLIRTWGFLNGAQDPYAVGVALQPSVGAVPLSSNYSPCMPTVS